MDAQTHWEKIYREKAPDAVSWYRLHLETSIELIEQAAADFSASIIDIGGGESTLIDDLLARGYHNVTVLDISQTAIDVTKTRLGTASENVRWLIGDYYDQAGTPQLRCMARPCGIPFSDFNRRAQGLCPSGGLGGQARRTCDSEHLRARRPNEMQWP